LSCVFLRIRYNINIFVELEALSMSQHFLLSAKARTLSVRKVMEMTHDEAFQVFKQLRWGAGEETACPVCGTIDRHYFRNDRKQWRCKACTHAFSVTGPGGRGGCGYCLW
jgi:transposase